MQYKKILAIIPAYNEAGRVSSVIRDIKSRYPHIDTLVIDDCSADGTANDARLAGSNVISLPFNLGIGGAVQTGFKYAKISGYDIAIQVDADGQHNPEFMQDILDPVIAGKWEMCIGSRFISSYGFKSSFLRRIGIKFFTHLIGVFTQEKLTDPTSGFRAVDRRLICLFSENYPIDFPEPESIVMAKHCGASIGEVPVIMHKRKGGSSSIRHMKSAYYMVKVTFAIMLWQLRKKRCSGLK